MLLFDKKPYEYISVINTNYMFPSRPNSAHRISYIHTDIFDAEMSA